MDKTISVCGCGWLGFPLAKNLKQRDYHVCGSTTSVDKLAKMDEEGIIPFQISLNPTLKPAGNVKFFKTDILFLNIPFRRDLEDPQYYFKQIDSIVAYAQSQSIKWIIFASSTSIYSPEIQDAHENLKLKAYSERSEVLCDIEDMLLKNSSIPATILRYAGLFGEHRIIGKFLEGKKDLTDRDAPVNLVHLDDALAVTIKIIEQKLTNEIFNVCCDEHPTRQTLYSQAALRRNLPEPQFLNESTKVHKLVNNSKLKEKLGYTFKYPDPLNCL